MTIAFRTLRTAGALLVLLLCALPVHAQGRPSTLALRVDALTTQQLLTSPASALVDPDRQVAAARYVNARIPGFLLTFALPIALLIYFWRNGLASAYRDRLRRRFRTEFAARWFFGATLALLAWVAALIPLFYLYRLDRVMGTSQESWTAWVASWVLSTITACVVVGTIAAVALWLADKTHQWYLYAIAGVVLVTVVRGYEGALPLRMSLVESLITIIAIAVAVTVADRVGFRRDDDPVSRLALVGGLLGCVYLIALPVYLSYVRGTVATADMAAVTLTGDRASAVRAMVLRADQDLVPICPDTFAMLYFARTPAIGASISTFNGAPNPCK